MNNFDTHNQPKNLTTQTKMEYIDKGNMTDLEKAKDEYSRHVQSIVLVANANSPRASASCVAAVYALRGELLLSIPTLLLGMFLTL